MFDGKAFGEEIVEAVKAHIARAVQPLEQRLAVLESRPPPERGEKGEPGEPGPRGFRGDDGINGKDGKDGVDGFGFDDIEVIHDGARGFAFNFHQGERVKSFGSFFVPMMIYRGAWSADECYGQGDTVTSGGSMWVCNAATGARPDEGVEGWTRAVRRGRDGKNGKDGERGPPGIDGRPGRDLMMDAVR